MHHSVSMFDSVSADAIPDSARAAAGYIDGAYRSWRGIYSRFGGDIPVLAIATSSVSDAHVADVENGDLNAFNAEDWIRRQHRQGFHRPCLYSSLEPAHTLVTELHHAGIHRGDYRLWLAHWTGVPHICGPDCGWPFLPPGATQWCNRWPGHPHINVDVSLTSEEWLHSLLADYDRAEVH